MTTLADALAARLAQLGVQRLYGTPDEALCSEAISGVRIEDPDLAVLLADADGRLGHHDGSGRLGAAMLEGQLLHLSSKPGGTSPVHSVSTAEELFEGLRDVPGVEIPATTALHLDLDLSEPIESPVAFPAQLREPVITLDPSMSSMSIVLLIGVGAVRSSVVDEVRELARRGGWGVINTWGARGIERWDSPFNFATVGLQSDDLVAGGIRSADMVVAIGVDPDELDLSLIASKLVQPVAPRSAAALIAGWPASRVVPERAPHHDKLAGVLTPMYESESVPLSAPRASLHLAGALPSGGVIVADPGYAGFWLARSTPTSAPESLCVPATVVPGFAAAAALVCALEGRPVLAVTDQIDGAVGSSPLDGAVGPGTVDESTAAILDVARGLNLDLSLQLWGSAGALDDVSAHVALTRHSLDGSGRQSDVSTTSVPVSTQDLDGVVAAMGQVVAWQGVIGDNDA